MFVGQETTMRPNIKAVAFFTAPIKVAILTNFATDRYEPIIGTGTQGKPHFNPMTFFSTFYLLKMQLKFSR